MRPIDGFSHDPQALFNMTLYRNLFLCFHVKRSLYLLFLFYSLSLGLIWQDVIDTTDQVGNEFLLVFSKYNLELELEVYGLLIIRQICTGFFHFES